MPTALNQLIHRLRSDALRHDGAGLSDGELLECYVVGRDEVAFEALVRRHGPMVFGVCRRILRNDADAEDAFQATFLVLVRKAPTIRPRGMVSNWLYGVAHNTALKAKSMIHQRRAKEIDAGTKPKAESNEEVWAQIQPLVDAELSRLPDKYRVPIILCDLEGKTIKEVVHHLGWPQGTVASRLTRGRALLARRLSKYGVTLSAGLLAIALSQGAASASVPIALTAATVQAAGLFASGKTAAACGASATAVALTDGMLKTMLFVKLKLAVAVCLIATVFTAGVGGIAYKLHVSNPSRQSSLHKLRVNVGSPHHEADDSSASQAQDVIPEKIERVESCSAATQPAVESSAKDVKAGDVILKAKVIVVRGSDGATRAFPPQSPSTSSPEKPQPPCKPQTLTFKFSPDVRVMEKLLLVLPKGQFVVVRGSSGPACPRNLEPTGPPTGVWHLVPDGKKVYVIGVHGEPQYNFTIREFPGGGPAANADHLGKWDFSATWSSEHQPTLTPPVQGQEQILPRLPIRLEFQNADG